MSRKEIWEKMKSLKQRIDIYENDLRQNSEQSIILENKKEQKRMEIQRLWLEFNKLYRELQDDKKKD